MCISTARGRQQKSVRSSQEMHFGLDLLARFGYNRVSIKKGIVYKCLVLKKVMSLHIWILQNNAAMTSSRVSVKCIGQLIMYLE